MTINDKILSLKNGRKISIVEAGKLDGKPVIAHNGTPGSRLLYKSWVEDAEKKGIRLIGYDRPGYGGSTPQPGRTVADAASDVAAIAKALKIDRIGVWGVSGGGPHALACAALLPDLVAAAASLASPAPYGSIGLNWMEGMGEDNVEEFGAALQGQKVLEKFISSAAENFLKSTPATLVEAFRTLVSPVDAKALTDDFASYLFECMREGITLSRKGWIDDDLAFTKPWGFELNQIRIPVMVMQGDQDKMVPFTHGQWLSLHVPGAITRLLKGDGHLTLSANRVAEVHSWLISKM